jgi:hypothetical protein
MQAKTVIIMVVAVLIVAHITMITGYQQHEDDEPRFRLRELMEALMDKRYAHIQILYVMRLQHKAYLD